MPEVFWPDGKTLIVRSLFPQVGAPEMDSLKFRLNGKGNGCSFLLFSKRGRSGFDGMFDALVARGG